MDENEVVDYRKNYRIVVLLNRRELEQLIRMELDSGLSTSSFVRQLILKEYHDYMAKRNNR